MKKIFLLLSLSILGLGLSAPAITGFFIRQADAEMLLAPLASQSGARFIRTDVTPGWFSSEMEFEIDHAQLRQLFPESASYVLRLQILHGPLLLTPRGLQGGIAYARVLPEFTGPVAYMLQETIAESATAEDLHIGLLAGFRRHWRLDVSASRLALTQQRKTQVLEQLRTSVWIDYRQDPEHGPLMDLTQHLTIDYIESGSPIEALQWTAQINSLSIELISLYAGLMGNGQRAGVAPGTLLEGLGDRAALLLLQKPLQADVRAAGSIYAGMHEGRLAILWPGLPDMRHLNDFRLSEVLRHLRVELQLAGDEQALRNSPVAEALDVYERQRLVRINNGQATVNASLEQGDLVINGEVLPLTPFF
jgi:hypothetical protein